MFTKSTYVVREHVAVLKLADTYDILEADTAQKVAVAQEKPGGLVTFLRFLINKQLLPTKVFISEQEGGPPILSIHRGPALFGAKVTVKTGDGREIGWFKSKVLSIGGGFYVFDRAGNQYAEIKGDWKGWNFKFIEKSGNQLGTVTKQWGGLAKELFTTADTYVIDLAPGQPQEAVMLLLAAGIAIDTVYKEK